MGAVAAGLAIAGTAMNYMANEEKNRARRARTRAEQAAIDAEEAERGRKLIKDVDVFKKESDINFGENVSAFARAGVDISSAINVLGSDKAEAQKQIAEIRRGAAADISTLRRQRVALAEQERVARRSHQLGQIGTILGGAGDTYEAYTRGK